MGEKYKKISSKLGDADAEGRRKCKCGHTIIFHRVIKSGYLICSWCGSRVYYDVEKQKEYDKEVAKNEFIFKVKNEINNANNKIKVETDKDLKTKTFNSNDLYLQFYNENGSQITIHKIEIGPKGSIKIYYGKRCGRPRKDAKGYAATGKRNSFRPFKHKSIEMVWK